MDNEDIKQLVLQGSEFEVLRACPTENCNYETPEKDLFFCKKCSSELIVKCKHCGKIYQIDPEAVYCGACGRDLRTSVSMRNFGI